MRGGLASGEWRVEGEAPPRRSVSCPAEERR
jgi:hypothetical protein